MSFYSIGLFIQAYYPEYWGMQSYPIAQCVRIRKVKEGWGVLGSFASTPFTAEGLLFDSIERLFQ